MSRKTRITALALAILAVFFFVGSPFGQSAKAVLVVDDVIIALILAALAAMGITFAITGGYQTAEQWVSQMITDSGISFAGSKYGANSAGSVLLNNRFVQSISALADYIRLRYNLVDNSSAVIQAESVVAGELVGVSLPFYTHVDYGALRSYLFVSSTEPVIGFACNRPYLGLMFYSTAPFTITRYQYADGQPTDSGFVFSFESQQRADHDYYYVGLLGDLNPNDVPIIYESTDYVLEVLDQGGADVGTQGGITANTGAIDIPDSSDIGGKGGILTLPIPWGDTFPDAIEKIPGLVLDDELVGETTLELEDESAVEDQIDQAATQQTVTTQPDDYQSPGLPDVFPFCIPFDIYAFFECLAADPVAPAFTWRFYVPGICDEEFTVDLAPFNSVAQIVRTMELLAFIVGLALVTRDKFLRG